MAKDRTKDLTQGTPWKVIAGFSLPVIGGNLFQLFYTLADSMIMSEGRWGRMPGCGRGVLATIRYFVLCFISGTGPADGNFTGTGIQRGNESMYANPYRRLYGSALCLQSY